MLLHSIHKYVWIILNTVQVIFFSFNYIICVYIKVLYYLWVVPFILLCMSTWKELAKHYHKQLVYRNKNTDLLCLLRWAWPIRKYLHMNFFKGHIHLISFIYIFYFYSFIFLSYNTSQPQFLSPSSPPPASFPTNLLPQTHCSFIAIQKRTALQAYQVNIA